VTYLLLACAAIVCAFGFISERRVRIQKDLYLLDRIDGLERVYRRIQRDAELAAHPELAEQERVIAQGLRPMTYAEQVAAQAVSMGWSKK
jgi:hypothetical protein